MNRYKPFINGVEHNTVPFIDIPERDTDVFIIYSSNFDTLDSLSYKYYNNEDYDWLILQANPELGSLEFDIPNNSLLRIPMPLSVVLQDYFDKAEELKNQ